MLLFGNLCMLLYWLFAWLGNNYWMYATKYCWKWSL